jgi:hypothetical protein
VRRRAVRRRRSQQQRRRPPSQLPRPLPRYESYKGPACAPQCVCCRACNQSAGLLPPPLLLLLLLGGAPHMNPSLAARAVSRCVHRARLCGCRVTVQPLSNA